MKLAGIVLAWMVILFTAAAAVCGIAWNGRLLAAEMLRDAPPEVTGLPEREYEAVGVMTADYLAGRTDVFQHTFSDEAGTVYRCFQSHEADHMEDCRELIRLAGVLRWAFGAAAAVLATGFISLKWRKGIARGVTYGVWSFAAVGTILLIWGLIDFDGLFTAFHRLVFVNEGWLLDPRTDLLIRLMPTELFVTFAVRILLWIAVAAAAAGTVGRLVLKTEVASGRPGTATERPE